MKKMTEFRIDISKPKKDFADHLNLEGNKRIIFSGPFGIGKTTFIKEFSEINEKKYNVIHLFPVNYSVSSNEDIFELIKYDLFYEILKFEHIVYEASISKLEHLSFFAKQEFHKLFHIFLKAVPKIGKPISEVLKDLDGLVGKFKEEHDALNKTEFTHIASFIEDMSESKGSIYEFDFYSSLIKSLLENIKGGLVKENILVIDDLDRVDPDHLFRLLNVFAAHVDFDKEEDNKFGFEKVVFVLDIKNVHNIFQNRYGQNVNFSGYIDKFYSKTVFEFNIQEEIVESLRALFESITTGPHSVADFSYWRNAITSEVVFLVRALIRSQALNLRSLLKLNGLMYSEIGRKITLSTKTSRDVESSKQLNFPLIIEFLRFLFGSTEGLETGLIKLKNTGAPVMASDSNSSNKVEDRISDLIPLLDRSNFPYNDSFTEKKLFRYDDYLTHISFDYTITRDNYRYGAAVQRAFILESNLERGTELADISLEAYFELLWETYLIYKKSIT
tara:strand:+ start:6264 stop:7769 length:1506 start_codon:yes stop_codon:yes gene_type:complete